jgi:hypothetical protein
MSGDGRLLDLFRRSGMSDDHRKPSLAFWTTVVLVVVLTGYPLSIGPLTRLYWVTLNQPAWLKAMADPVYAPMHWAYANGPNWYQNAVAWYCDWWVSF